MGRGGRGGGGGGGGGGRGGGRRGGQRDDFRGEDGFDHGGHSSGGNAGGRRGDDDNGRYDSTAGKRRGDSSAVPAGAGGGGSGAAEGKSNFNARNVVSYMEPQAPKFIQQLRAMHGLKSRKDSHHDQMALKAARPTMPEDGEGDDDDMKFARNDEEAPMIVVLKRGDLDKDEVVAAVEKGAVGAEAVFVKGKTESAAVPAETASEATKSTETTPATVVTTTAGQKRSAVTDVGSRAEKVRKTLPGSLSKSLDKQNKTLLSFNDEDDDE